MHIAQFSQNRREQTAAEVAFNLRTDNHQRRPGRRQSKTLATPTASITVGCTDTT